MSHLFAPVSRLRRGSASRIPGLRCGSLAQFEDSSRSGALKGPSVQAKLEALEARQSEVAQELAGLLEEPVRLHPNLAAIYRRKVAELQSLLETDSTRTEAVEIIRSLIDQVKFWPTADAGLQVELVGDIARMVHLAQTANGNSPISGAVHDEFVRSVKVVAGVGFEPTTFRL